MQEDTLDNLGEDEKDAGKGHVLIIDNLEESHSGGSSKGGDKVGYGLGGSRNGKNSGSEDDDKNGKNKLDDKRDSMTKAENNSLQYGNASINDDKDKNGTGEGEGDNKEDEDSGEEKN